MGTFKKYPKFLILVILLTILAFSGQVYVGVHSFGWKPALIIVGITILVYGYPLYRAFKLLHNSLNKSS